MDCTNWLGFFSHQTDMLNTTKQRAWDTPRFARDFDFFGYQYALLSSVGSAGLNNVINMLPARDADEYESFPQEDVLFIKRCVVCSLLRFCLARLVCISASQALYSTGCAWGQEALKQNCARVKSDGLHGPTTTSSCFDQLSLSPLHLALGWSTAQ